MSENIDENVKETANPLSVSDADFAEMPLDSILESVEEEVTESTPETTTEEDANEDIDVAAEKDVESTTSSDEEKIGASEENAEETSTDTEKEEKTVSTAEAQIAELFAPFRANNKDMQIDNIEDARTLMQMGANYNKKMAAIKPNLRIIKMLENNGLLDESKLTYLIDLDKKDPEAIKKLIQESKVDPDTLDLEQEADYKPNTYTVSDDEVNLDGILGEIQDTDSFSETINIISNKWDESSKQILIKQPEIIKHINDHVASGIYAKIDQEVARQRMLGKLTGVSDLEAYKQVGDEIEAAGGFNTTTVVKQTSTTKAATTSVSKNTVDTKLRDRKKAASSTKASRTSNKTPDDFNPLSLSDEEFAKIGNDKFM